MTLSPKDPDSVIPYQLDARTYIRRHNDALGVSDTLSAIEVVVVDTNDIPVVSPDLVIEDSSFTAEGLVTVWVSGGTAGTTYRVRVRLTGTLVSPVQLVDDELLTISVEHK